jgi:phage terminase small subunit
VNKKPPELHVVDGTKPRTTDPVQLPASIRKRIPQAEWLDNPGAWDKKQFIAETSEYLFDVYGIGDSQNKHTLGMLADQIDLYIKCNIGIEKNGVIAKFNDGKTIGPNPFITVRDKTLAKIIVLMNELGLTPRSRLSKGVQKDDSPAARFLAGPLAR